MLAVALAGLSGLVWGVGDFAGGKASQRAAAPAVAWLSKLLSLPLLAAYLVLLAAPLYPAALAWGAAAGVFGMAGMMLFYRALSTGAMTIVAPVTAVTSAVIPVVVGLAAGERPPAPQLAGVLCALVAIALVSLAPSRPGERAAATPSLLGLAVASGVGFALFFVLVARAGAVPGGEAGLWPILGSQASALLVGGLFLLVTRAAAWPQRAGLGWVVVAGVFDMTANALYLLATRSGELSLVAPLAALYPVSTVVLALIIDRERLRRLQVAGLVLAVAALVLVSG